MISSERIEDIVSAIRVFTKTAAIAHESATSELGRFCGREYVDKCLKQERIRRRAIRRLSLLLKKECDKIVAQSQEIVTTDLPKIRPVTTKLAKVWGGQLLGWTTQSEVSALDRSIETDY